MYVFTDTGTVISSGMGTGSGVARGHRGHAPLAPKATLQSEGALLATPSPSASCGLKLALNNVNYRLIAETGEHRQENSNIFNRTLRKTQNFAPVAPQHTYIPILRLTGMILLSPAKRKNERISKNIRAVYILTCFKNAKFCTCGAIFSGDSAPLTLGGALLIQSPFPELWLRHWAWVPVPVYFVKQRIQNEQTIVDRRKSNA